MKKSASKRGPGNVARLYLASYNALQCAGWGFILYSTLLYLVQHKTYNGLWARVAHPTKVFQTLALLEVVHCIIGIVASSPFLTLIQVLSRLMVVWGILIPVPESQNQYGIVMLLVAWCIAEITRYSFYGLTLYNSCPPALTWCRYSFFLVLYPTGVTGEIVTMVSALPYIKRRQIFTMTLPNAANFSFDYHLAVILIIASYAPFFPQLFGHLLKQRTKFLSPKQESKKA